MYTSPTVVKRFWAMVAKSDECWLWIGSTGQHGYGQLNLGTKRENHIGRANRISWEIHFGPVPKGLHVLHHCDNPPCVRPDHLFLGTPADNSKDRTAKRRAPCGENASWSKLTAPQVRAIRADPRLQKEIAKNYNITQTAVSCIKLRKNWGHLE